MSAYCIAVLNQKGGTGKTTVSCNLGAAAHLEGLRTTVLDLDTSGGSQERLHRSQQMSISQWYAARRDDSLLAGLGVVRVDGTLSAPKVRELTDAYDVAVIDGPANVSDPTVTAAIAADIVIIPLSASYLDMWASSNTVAAIDVADQIRAELQRPPVRRAFLLNAVDKRTRLYSAARAELTEGYVGTLARRNDFVAAVGAGESVLTFAPKSLAAQEVRTLWNHIKKPRHVQAAA